MSERVVHVNRAPYDIYIGRSTRMYKASKWGNPFRIGMDPMMATQWLADAARSGAREPIVIEFDGPLDRAKAIECYEAWLRCQPGLLAALPELHGKVLGCWCAPEPCDGDVLVRLSEEPVRA